MTAPIRLQRVVTWARRASGPLVLVALGWGAGAWLTPSAPAPAGPVAGSPSTPAAEAATWTCSMHPQVQASEAGQCPICGMDLIPASQAGGAAPAADEVRLDPRAQILARIRTAEVAPMPFEGSTRSLLGRVVADEARLKTITAWVEGRVERLQVATTGEPVRKGQALAQIYSPALYAAHQDLLAAQAQVATLAKADPVAQRAARAQVEAARRKIRLWGFSQAVVDRMAAAKAPWTRFTVRSPLAGTVLQRQVQQGQYLKEGAPLFQVADLGEVWVTLDAYEADLPHLQVGRPVQLTVDALPGTSFEGQVRFIDPVVDPRTRVAQVRIVLPNPDGRLKPGMYARATVAPALTQAGRPLALAIPRSAPLFAGDRALVYVEQSSDTEGAVYVAREVVLGPRVGEQYPVLAGLSRGERVVVHGAFALDSDLQIRGALSLMARPDDTERGATPTPLILDEADTARLRPALAGYLDVQERLAADDWPGAKARIDAWATAVAGVELKDPVAAAAWQAVARRLAPDLEALTHAEAIKPARARFSLVTRAMDVFLARFGNVSQGLVRKAYCPMAADNRGDHWYQRADQVDNVYFGNQMRRCGEIQQALDQGAHLLSPAAVDDASAGHPHGH